MDNSDFEGEKLWIGKLVLGSRPQFHGNGAGGATSFHKARCGQRFISKSQILGHLNNRLPLLGTGIG